MPKSKGKSKTKQKDKVSDHIERLKFHPYSSKEYKSILKIIAKGLKSKYKNQSILCMPRNHIEGGIHSVSSNEDIEKLLNITSAFVPNHPVQYLPRWEVEYDMAYRQIIVGCYLTDGTKYVLLKKKSDGTITFIGGHVDFTLDAYNFKMGSYLVDNLIRELVEEVSLGKNGSWEKVLKNNHPKPITYIDTVSTFYDYFNNGLIYEIRVGDVDDLVGIKSGEPDNHSVEIFDSINDIVNGKQMLHSWVHEIFTNKTLGE